MAGDPIRATYRAGARDDKTASARALEPALAEFLQVLARAARQFRTYPAASPLCIDAVTASAAAFAACELTAPLLLRVTPRNLIVDDVEAGCGTIVEQELARPLHRARVASLEIDTCASPRDWAQFCVDLFRVQRLADTKITLGELLAEGGVAAIRPRVAPRPEIVDIGAPPAPVRALVERERARLATAATGPAQYFYPPAKGWIRFDPAVSFDTVSLLDLAVFLDDPSELAGVLMRLTDDDADENATTATPLEQKYADVVTLVSALDPRLARVLLSKLAHAVLGLDGERRRTLLRRTILPGLLDGRTDAGLVLGEFPDVDLADALCLLLDLETAAPEVLSTALDRLALSADRRQSVVPLLERRLSGRDSEPNKPDGRALESYAGALIRIGALEGKRFDEFAAFDLSITPATLSALDDIRDAVHVADPVQPRAACLAHLVRLEPNPTVVAGFADRGVSVVRELVQAGRWRDAAEMIQTFVEAAASIRDARPESASAVSGALATLVDRSLVMALAARCDDAAHRTWINQMVRALGPAIVTPWVDALGRAADSARARQLAGVIADDADAFAPALAAHLPSAALPAARCIVSILGHTHGRYEALIGDQLARGDEPLGREALRALARIGSRESARVVVDALARGPAWARTAAEEALWRFSPAVAFAAARELLTRRSFVLQEPQIAERLLDRIALGATTNLDPLLAQLVPLRFRFWNPALVRIAEKAKQLQQ